MTNFKLNIQGGQVVIVIRASVKISPEVKINNGAIALKASGDFTFRSAPVLIRSAKLFMRLQLNAAEDGIVHFEFYSDHKQVFESPFYYIPGEGSHLVKTKFDVGLRYGMRTKPGEFMKRFASGFGDPELELDTIDLFYNDGRVTTLAEPNVTIPVYYATDRNELRDDNGRLIGYGGKRSELRYGLGEVNIPKHKRKGELPRPEWWFLKWPENINKHVTILQIDGLSAGVFFDRVSHGLLAPGAEDIFVFIHGYNESFDSSLMRAAQLAYDTGFTGLTSVFSWPSANALLGYMYDENAVRWAIPHLKAFLTGLKERIGKGKIHIIAHSMGNEPFTRALLELKQDGFYDHFLFSQLILAAPDLDQQIFARDTADGIAGSSIQVTLYANEHDRALWASKVLRGNQVRLGTFKKNHVINGIDMVDATKQSTGFMGHGYFSQTKLLIDDIRKILVLGQGPAERELVRVPVNTGHYWAFKTNS